MARHFRDRLALTYAFWSVVLVAATGALAWKFGWLPIHEKPEGAAFVASNERKFAKRKPAMPQEFAAEPTEVAELQPDPFAAAARDRAPQGDPLAAAPRSVDPDWAEHEQAEPASTSPAAPADELHQAAGRRRAAQTQVAEPSAVTSAAWEDEEPDSRPTTSARVPPRPLEEIVPGSSLAAPLAQLRRKGAGDVNYGTVATESPPGDDSEHSVVIRPKRPARPAPRENPARRAPAASGAVMLDREPPQGAFAGARSEAAAEARSGTRSARRFSRDEGFSEPDGQRGILPAGKESAERSNSVSMPDPRLSEITRLMDQGERLPAHKEMSRLYWKHPELVPDLQSKIDDNAKLIYFSAQPHFMEPYVVEPGDQLSRIAKKYNVSWEYLAKLNGVDPKKIRADQRLKVIKGPFAAIADLSDFELVVHCHGYYVKRYAIGVGKNESTPTGKFAVKTKLVNPTYYGPNGLVIDADDSSNPLGERWIDLGDSYGIHGTIDPASIGKAESRGCIRLKNADVEELFDLLTEGSEVILRQ